MCWCMFVKVFSLRDFAFTNKNVLKDCFLVYSNFVDKMKNGITRWFDSRKRGETFIKQKQFRFA